MQIPIFPAVTYPEKKLAGQYCLSPFITISIRANGDVGLCSCSAWMPTIIGNIFNSTLESMLSSPIAVNIRQSIIDGNYRYCNEKACVVLGNNSLNSLETCPPQVQELIKDSSKFNMPTHITLSGDATCNLSCPSCRTEVIKVKEEQREKNERLGDILITNLLSTPTDQPITILLSTSGELFASPMLLKFLNRIKKSDFPNLQLEIQTNGLLCERSWHKLGDLQNSVKKLTITADSCRPGTYEFLRRGGTYNELLSAMKFLQSKKNENGMQFCVRSVLQRANYKEVEDFYKFAMTYEADQVEYVRLNDWNTRTKEEHFAEDVFDPLHPNYSEACKILNRIRPLPNTWIAGGLPSSA